MNTLPVRVLLVDDDEDDFVMTDDLLDEIEETRFDLDWVDTFAGGLDAVTSQSHDVYLFDYRLGEHTGLDLLREAIQSGCKAPVILLTGQDDPEIDKDAMEAGAADYLVKGQISPQLLERSIRYALRHQNTLDALRESQERYEIAVQGANDGIWDWNLRTNEMHYSPRWENMVGYEADELKRHPDAWFSRIHPHDAERVNADISAHLAGQTGHFESEYRLQHQDSSYRWMLSRGLAVCDGDGVPYRIAGSQTDITNRKETERRLLQEALYDNLTHLPNRALFMERLERAILRANRDRSYLFALLFLDLDRFKNINDSLGHSMGDQLLIALGRRLEQCMRSQDTIARLGGDEFTILLEDVEDLSSVIRVAERVQEEVMRPFSLGRHEVFTSTSIGITLSTAGYEEPGEALRDADIAMYRAKARGKACHEVFDRHMHDNAVQLLEIEADLRRALDRQEFELYYQPIVDLRSGAINRVEALLRWHHPERGFVSPGEFIPIAEETGLIIPVGEWTLKAACAQIKRWHEEGYSQLRVDVNVSARQFQDQNLLDLVRSVLHEARLDPSALELEITETITMQQIERTTHTLDELARMGINTSIDDFGTGYSSLAYLKRFPIHTLKVDRSFIADCPGDEDQTAIAKAIIAMAHSLKLNIVAEGVETEEQLAFLESQRCQEFQGYLVSRPLPARELAELLETRCPR